MLANRTLVVTGAASGLGAAITAAAVEQGALVAALDIDAARLEAFAAPFGDAVAAFPCDVRDPAAVARTVQAVQQWRPQVDVLISNAGVWTDNELEAVDPARRSLAFETNAVGAIHVIEAFLPGLLAQKSAHIFNVISVAGDGLSPASDNRAWRTYGATKWALTGYTKALRESLAGTDVRVSGFFPGGIDTNFYEYAGKTDAHGQPWMMSAKDMADIVLFALTRPADVTIESLTVVKHAT